MTDATVEVQPEASQAFTSLTCDGCEGAAMTIEGSFGSDRAGHTLLREMLYVDTGRVRSYLAQLEQGLPERVQRVEEKMRQWSVGAGVMVGRAGTGRQSSSREQQDRTLSDLHFAIFEDVAEQVGFLTDVSDKVTTLEDWTTGRLHTSLQEGHAIRVTAPTRLTDGEHTIALFQKFARAGVSYSTGSETSGDGGESAATAELLATMRGDEPAGHEDVFLQEMEVLVRLLFGTGIWVRCMPCGAQHPEACFSGVLLDRSEYIDPERFAIFSRYGADVRDWTVVGTVTRLSKQLAAPPLNFSALDTSDMTTPDGILDRNQVEDMLSKMLEYFETQGITEGPRWPSIIITPLAVYRQVDVTPAAYG
jgi:hypothetical protein